MTASGPEQSGHPEQDPRADGQPAPEAWPPPGPGGAQPWPPARPPSGQPSPGQPAGSGDAGAWQPPYGQPPAGQPSPGQPSWGPPPPGQQPHSPASSGWAPYGQQQYGQSPYGQQSYGQQPYDQQSYGQQPYGQPPYGQQSYGQPSGHQPYGPPSTYAPGPGHGPGRPARPVPGFDVRRLRIADQAVAAATLLTLIFMLPNWYSGGFFNAYNGFDVSPMTFGFLLLVLATGWTVVAVGADLRPQVPRGVVTVSLTGLALLMTLIAWLRTFADGFSVPALLTLFAVSTAATFAVLGLLPELRDRPAPTGQLGQAAAWASRPGPMSTGAAVPPQPGGWQPPQKSSWAPPAPQGWHAGRPGAPGASPPPPGGATAWQPPGQDGGAAGRPGPHDRG
ncbi:hypothetical protein [uncultured Modestobacter sp.]|uniref:hypothetical protein n=1 Tax=uncultured Modestobacter sp. TaxID=380048 RepID=UPI00260E3EA3|nr:hypothetical protein [uncultured Modestobacter sp.]